jgi:soluble lytic murein transglycosylase-like protein
VVSLLNGLSGLGSGLSSGMGLGVNEALRRAIGGAADPYQAALERAAGLSRPLLNGTPAPVAAAPAAASPDPTPAAASPNSTPAAPADATAAPAKVATTADGRGPMLALLTRAIYGQESGSGTNTATSVTGAKGGMQIQPATFAQYARPGESIDNPEHNLAVGRRIIADLWQKSGGDPARVAVGYFSGPGNIAPPDSPTPWRRDVSDPTGKSVSGYVGDVLGRIRAMA